MNRLSSNLCGLLLFSITTAFQANSNAVPTAGLVASYCFEGNANDSSGNGNDGVVSGATLTTGRSGSPSSAYSFDLDTDEISLPTSLLAGSAASVSFWFKSDQVVSGTTGSSSFSPLFAREPKVPSVGTSKLLAFAVGDGTSLLDGEILTITVGSDTVPYNYRSGVATTTLGEIDTNWHHIAVTSDSSGHHIYFDGLDYAPTLFAGGFTASHNLFPIAAEFIKLGGMDYLDGEFRSFDLDDVYFYDRAISSAEVFELYQASACVPESGSMAALLLGGFGLLAAAQGIFRREGSFAAAASPSDHRTGGPSETRVRL